MSTETAQLFDKVAAMRQQVADYPVANPAELEQYRIAFIGTKGQLKDLFGAIKDVAPEQKKAYGQAVNELKQFAEGRYQALKEQFESAQTTAKQAGMDLTKPGDAMEPGSRHPIQIVRNQILEIFRRIGYTVMEGPEIEDDWHNFTALNFPPDHPARDMQDTFFVNQNPDMALRTHTSSVQVRVMETQKPPIRAVFPGRVYRNETISARAHCFFHQVEGLYIDKNVSFADLKQTLYYFATEFFGADTKIRFRPSYFPFTEPSAEFDVSCFICGGDGCAVCKHSGWVEILGCGMVDPAVLENCGIDPNEYSGFAFGMGIDRTAMLKYQINDIRLLSENDVRFLRQFRSAY